MNVGVLGALQVRLGESSIVPTARKPRGLLALLALNANSVVTVGSIADELWEGSLPKSASTTLQTYILHIRKRIAREISPGEPDTNHAKRILVTCGNGYLLNNEGGRCDAAEFDRLANLGMRRCEEGDHQSASELLRNAMELWRGPALVDVHVGPVLEAEVLRLEERRRAVMDSRVQVDLALGRHHSIVDELSGLVVRDRTHEGLHGQLMLALYRCGRRAHALQVFQRLRLTMLDELGLEPSPWLHRLQQAILATDPALDDGSTTVGRLVAHNEIR
ncbi:AfsR/SARP family transcriptional regulator [Streptomyces sp. NPDC001002]